MIAGAVCLASCLLQVLACEATDPGLGPPERHPGRASRPPADQSDLQLLPSGPCDPSRPQTLLHRVPRALHPPSTDDVSHQLHTAPQSSTDDSLSNSTLVQPADEIKHFISKKNRLRPIESDSPRRETRDKDNDKSSEEQKNKGKNKNKPEDGDIPNSKGKKGKESDEQSNASNNQSKGKVDHNGKKKDNENSVSKEQEVKNKNKTKKGQEKKDAEKKAVDENGGNTSGEKTKKKPNSKIKKGGELKGNNQSGSDKIEFKLKGNSDEKGSEDQPGEVKEIQQVDKSKEEGSEKGKDDKEQQSEVQNSKKKKKKPGGKYDNGTVSEKDQDTSEELEPGTRVEGNSTVSEQGEKKKGKKVKPEDKPGGKKKKKGKKEKVKTQSEVSTEHKNTLLDEELGRNLKIPLLEDGDFRISDDYEDWRVAGGSLASERQFPWVASLYTDDRFCGGTLISLKAVLTAAHCLVTDHEGSELSLLPAEKLSVRAGSLQPKSGGQVTVAKKLIVHPDYLKMTEIILYRDLAIVYVKDTFYDLTPATIPSKERLFQLNHMEKEGVELQFAGWGVTDLQQKKIENHLRFASIPLVNYSLCRDLLTPVKGYGILNKAVHICLYDGKKDSCSGDSGGGLMHGSEVWGVASFGLTDRPDCGQPGPAVFAKIDPSFVQAELDSPLISSAPGSCWTNKFVFVISSTVFSRILVKSTEPS